MAAITIPHEYKTEEQFYSDFCKDVRRYAEFSYEADFINVLKHLRNYPDTLNKFQEFAIREIVQSFNVFIKNKRHLKHEKFGEACIVVVECLSKIGRLQPYIDDILPNIIDSLNEISRTSQDPRAASKAEEATRKIFNIAAQNKAVQNSLHNVLHGLQNKPQDLPSEVVHPRQNDLFCIFKDEKDISANAVLYLNKLASEKNYGQIIDFVGKYRNTRETQNLLTSIQKEQIADSLEMVAYWMTGSNTHVSSYLDLKDAACGLTFMEKRLDRFLPRAIAAIETVSAINNPIQQAACLDAYYKLQALQEKPLHSEAFRIARAFLEQRKSPPHTGKLHLQVLLEQKDYRGIADAITGHRNYFKEDSRRLAYLLTPEDVSAICLNLSEGPARDLYRCLKFAKMACASEQLRIGVVLTSGTMMREIAAGYIREVQAKESDYYTSMLGALQNLANGYPEIGRHISSSENQASVQHQAQKSKTLSAPKPCMA